MRRRRDGLVLGFVHYREITMSNWQSTKYSAPHSWERQQRDADRERAADRVSFGDKMAVLAYVLAFVACLSVAVLGLAYWIFG